MSENVPSIDAMTIKIKKDKGITHALKDVVDNLIKQKKAELTDGKITLQEWNAVMDKLIELQNNRKAQGKASIFGGGTDKTNSGWHNSFVVHPDQEISFTAEETAQIYEAMGVVIKNTNAPAANQNAPENPNAPAQPNTPENPNAPAQPNAPENPNAPAQPNTPENPNAPAQPNTPENPNAPAQPNAPENPNASQETPGPNGTTIKNGEYFAADGTKLAPEYARGTEIQFVDENGNKTASVRVWEGGEKVTYRDVDGKIISIKEFMQKYPNEYTQTISQQFVNYAGEEVASQISFNPDPDGNKKFDGKVEFTYNGKTIKAGLPISVKNVADLLGIQKKAPEAPQAQEAPETPEAPANQTPLPEGATEVAGKDADGVDCHIVKDKDGRELKRIYNKGQEDEYSVTVEYDNNGKKTKEIETQSGNNKTDIIRYYNPNGKLGKVENYQEDGTTIRSTAEYQYNEDGSYTQTNKNGDGKTTDIYEYNKDGNTQKVTSYKEDGKTPNIIVENGIVRLTHIKTKNADGKEVAHRYEFDENGICISSGLALELYNQIEPSSLNSNTIKKLEQLNAKNIIKVLTAYQKLAGHSLQQAIDNELGFGKDKMRKLVNDALNARLKELGLDPAKVNINDPKQLAEIAKLDNKNS